MSCYYFTVKRSQWRLQQSCDGILSIPPLDWSFQIQSLTCMIKIPNSIVWKDQPVAIKIIVKSKHNGKANLYMILTKCLFKSTSSFRSLALNFLTKSFSSFFQNSELCQGSNTKEKMNSVKPSFSIALIWKEFLVLGQILNCMFSKSYVNRRLKFEHFLDHFKSLTLLIINLFENMYIKHEFQANTFHLRKLTYTHWFTAQKV